MVVKNYNFVNDDNTILHSIDLKISQNSKLGLGSWVVQTYHFAIDQLGKPGEKYNFQADANNCMGCPYSYSANGPMSGKCYTHKGSQRMGVGSKLRSLKRKYEAGKISKFNPKMWHDFIISIPSLKLDLVRFGAYGEPVSLSFELVDQLASMAPKMSVTGYTHAWQRPEMFQYSKWFMASVHNQDDAKTAQNSFWRTFLVSNTQNPLDVVCPAAKESGKDVICSDCGLCGGNSLSAKNIQILQH